MIVLALYIIKIHIPDKDEFFKIFKTVIESL